MRQAWVNEFGEQDSRSAPELLGEKRVVYGFFREEIHESHSLRQMKIERGLGGFSEFLRIDLL
jgi:hypothetical protein